jgi:hypothetical protein
MSDQNRDHRGPGCPLRVRLGKPQAEHIESASPQDRTWERTFQIARFGPTPDSGNKGAGTQRMTRPPTEAAYSRRSDFFRGGIFAAPASSSITADTCCLASPMVPYINPDFKEALRCFCKTSHLQKDDVPLEAR